MSNPREPLSGASPDRKSRPGTIVVVLAIGSCCVLVLLLGSFLLHIGKRLSAEHTPETPSVVLGLSPDTLVLNNTGKEDIYLWGTKLGSGPQTIDQGPRTVSAGRAVNLYAPPGLAAGMKANEARLVPFEGYFADKIGRNYTGKFALRITLKNGIPEAAPQNLGPMTRGGWTKPER
jgi:hypothetical protein